MSCVIEDGGVNIDSWRHRVTTRQRYVLFESAHENSGVYDVSIVRETVVRMRSVNSAAKKIL